MTALETVRLALESSGCRPRVEGDGYRALCPACQMDGKHDPGLTLTWKDGKALVYCHGPGGCPGAAVAEALGLTVKDLFDEPRSGNGHRRPAEVARWSYVDETGSPLVDVIRLEPGPKGHGKTFTQRLPGHSKGGIGNVRRVLYRLPEVLAVVEERGTVYLVEGEKCADALNAWPDFPPGCVSTTHMGGASNWKDEYADTLLGCGQVIVWRDKDEPGIKWGRAVCASLDSRNIPRRLVESKTGHDAGDDPAAELVNVGEAGEITIEAVDVFTVERSVPEYHVSGLVQKGGFSYIWATRGGGKSYLELALAISLLQPEPCGDLFGISGLKINSGYSRVLWMACEETAERLRYRSECIMAGMGLKQPDPGSLMHIPARSPSFTVTLEHLPKLIDKYSPDCVVVDYVTGFRKRADEQGRPIKWDLDNDEAHESTRPIREITKAGIDVRLVHHANAEGSRARGASEWGNACDTEIQLEDKGDGNVLMRVLKQKDAARIKPTMLSFGWQSGTLKIGPSEDPIVSVLTPQERAAVAYLEGVGANGPAGKRLPGSIGESIGVARARASEIMNSIKAKGYADYEDGLRGARLWFSCHPDRGAGPAAGPDSTE